MIADTTGGGVAGAAANERSAAGCNGGGQCRAAGRSAVLDFP